MTWGGAGFWLVVSGFVGYFEKLGSKGKKFRTATKFFSSSYPLIISAIKGQLNCKYGTRGRVVPHVDGAVMFRNNGVSNGKSEPGSRFTSGKIRLKQSQLNLFRHAGTIIFDRQSDCLFLFSKADLCADGAAALKDSHCVIKQVDQDPFDLNRIKEKRRNIIMVQGEGDMFVTFTVQH